MAIEYELMLVTQLAPRQAIEIVAQSTDPQAEITDYDNDPDKFYVLLPGTHVDTSKPILGSPISLRFYNEDIGFIPPFRVSFQFAWTDTEYSHDSMFKATVALLHATDGDAVLFHNSGEVVLRRKAGQLTLNSDYQWSADDLKLIDIPYTLLPIPYL